MNTDVRRWNELSQSVIDPGWGDRNSVVVHYILNDMKVLDVGAGNMMLKRLLHKGCTYTPMDCVKGAPNTIVYDFNGTKTAPTDLQFDTVVCSGIMEYIHDWQRFISIVTVWTNHIVLTYTAVENRSKFGINFPEKNGWVNSLSLTQIKEAIAHCGFEVVDETTWARHSILNLKRIT